MDPVQARPFCQRLARHFASTAAWPDAEAQWLRAGLPLEAVEMHARAGDHEAARRVARAHLPEAELRRFNAARAAEAEAAGDWKEAERGFVAAGDVDAAVAMYERRGMHAALLRLVAQHRPAALPEARATAARKLAAAGAWREAERCFLDGGDWAGAVEMHKGRGAWEDALRVARAASSADPSAPSAVAFAWAASLPPADAAALLRRLGLAAGAVDAAVAAGAFDQALQLALSVAPAKVNDVRLARAMRLEDTGRFADAEAEFVAAGRPREAIEMHVHCRDFEAALRVAEAHDPEAAEDVLAAQVMGGGIGYESHMMLMLWPFGSCKDTGSPNLTISLHLSFYVAALAATSANISGPSARRGGAARRRRGGVPQGAPPQGRARGVPRRRPVGRRGARRRRVPARARARGAARARRGRGGCSWRRWCRWQRGRRGRRGGRGGGGAGARI